MTNRPTREEWQEEKRLAERNYVRALEDYNTGIRKALLEYEAALADADLRYFDQSGGPK